MKNEKVIYKYIYNKLYYRGTDDKNEPEYIINGTFHLSKNHQTNKREKGLSVADVFNDESGISVSSTYEQLLKYFKYVYVITGDEIGVGSDSEPLLDIKSLKFVNWIKGDGNE